MEPAYAHESVLLPEVVASLAPHDGGVYLDGTLGGGGHAAAILDACKPSGRLLGCDRDADALSASRRRLAGYAGRFEVRQGSYEDVPQWVAAGSCDGALLDLGLSSHELDSPARGFSFQREGPLDMRYDQREPGTAADLVNTAPADELERIFRHLGDERHARRIAAAIERARKTRRIETTMQLAEVIAGAVPGWGRGVHPATRVFLALRLAVNDELGVVSRGLPAVWSRLKPGGRLAVITFHSGEDRIVKQFGRERERGYDLPGGVDVPELRRARPAQLRWLSRKPVRPSAAEVQANPRARSAQLRVMIKLA